MAFVFMNHRIVLGRKQFLYLFGTFVAWITLESSGFGAITAIVLLALMYSVLRFAITPLSRFIARIGYSIRWKFEIGIAAVALLFLVVSLIQVNAMNFMHYELHDIQELGPTQPFRMMRALDALNTTHHGFLFDRFIPILSVLGVLGAAALGAAMAWSVVDPLRRMGQGMGRIASGDFSQPVQVENMDELGELAQQINQTSADLAMLQEATLAAERDRGLRERMAQVSLAQEEERRRISRELHDGLGPSLASIGLRLRSCQHMVRSDPQRAEGELDELANSLKGHVQDIRSLIHDLRPLALDQLGLVGAVKQYTERFGQESGLHVSFDTSGGVDMDPLAEVTIFRVIQECLNNIQKHAEASHVEVQLLATGSGLAVMVKDDGKGFDSDSATRGRSGPGMGLLSMRERAEILGGSLSIKSSPQSGCETTLHIPAKKVEVGTHSNPTGG